MLNVLTNSNLYVHYICQQSSRGGLALWMIKLAYSIHSVLLLSKNSSSTTTLTSSSNSNSTKGSKNTSKDSNNLQTICNDLYLFWINPFSNSNERNSTTTCRADDLALSLLSVLSKGEIYIPWLEVPSVFNWESNNLISSLNQLFTIKLNGIPHISKTSTGSKKQESNSSSKDNSKEDINQSEANLTSRLIGSILEIDNSLSCRIISKVLCQLSADILIPVCCSGPISR